jgi:hypothetical protein
MMGNMLIEIHRQFEKRKIETVKQLVRNVLFSHVHKNVSRKAVDRLVAKVADNRNFYDILYISLY